MVCPFLAINECFTIFHDKCFYKDECPDILYFATFPAIEVTLLFQIYNFFLFVLLEFLLVVKILFSNIPCRTIRLD